jgi:putative hydrolase of the HAD superfamily
MTPLVSFDYGQTLCELDVRLLSQRAAERGVSLAPEALTRASPGAWRAYDEAKRQGLSGRDAWCSLLEAWLAGAGAVSEARPLSEWLWGQQPAQNLWRRPISGMLELITDLADQGHRLAIVSNSEGKLLELLQEIGIADRFAVVIDSGKLGFEKPDPRMFELATSALGGRVSDLVHVGDAWEADVMGALQAGAQALWFAASEPRVLPPGVRACPRAADVRRELSGLGVRL